METAILNSNSKSDLRLILELAKKLGVSSNILSKNEIEDISLGNAIKKGRTKNYVDTNDFLKKLKK